jgi:methylmalonyl-CoA mutase C-terminal domain/subunit
MNLKTSFPNPKRSDFVSNRKMRVLIGKPGLDGHDRGAKIISKALRDEGFEVIYTGLRNSPEQIVSAAIQESVDLIGLSILSGAHRRICRRVMELLEQNGATDIPVMVGGIIPDEDIAYLKEAGIRAIFGPGTSLAAIVGTVKNILAEAAWLQSWARSKTFWRKRAIIRPLSRHRASWVKQS